ncbi:hypothetical protein [Thalassiella azotivora]
MAWSGSDDALGRLVERLSDDVAPACREVPGHGWVTAVRMDGEDAVTVTSFWESADAAAPGGVGEQRLSVLGGVDGCVVVSSSRYDVRHVLRHGATLPGFVVSAASFPYDAGREDEAVRWATEVSQDAAALPGFTYGVVELADGPRVISVTTWRSRPAFDSAEPMLRQRYDHAPDAVDTSDRQWRRGTVVFSSSGDPA